MCGIVGILGKKTNKIFEIQKMLTSQKHRGPDAMQYWENNYIAFGHNRLSIIDLSDIANQPMLSNCNQYCIVFNGEIYNYLELKEQLKHDYQFKTNSDTEVLLAAYIVWGKKCSTNSMECSALPFGIKITKPFLQSEIDLV